jgi:outer membrane protein assembly factor BamA
MRYNLSRSFQVASFVDTGNVYLEAHDVDLTDLRWSTGLGVRYRTPIGRSASTGATCSTTSPASRATLPPDDRACF